MKIVQVLENFFPDSIGGTETYVLNISRFFMDAGHEVHVVAPSINGNRDYLLKKINVHRYSIDKVASKAEYKQLTEPKGLDDFIHIIKSIRPDIVHFNTFNRSINIYHLKAVKELGIKAFLTPHISGIFCAKGSMIDYQNRKCDGIVRNHNCVKCYLRSNNYSLLSSLFTIITEKFINIHPNIDKFIPAPAFIKKNRTAEFDCLVKYADKVIALSPWIESTLKLNGISNTILVRQGISKELINPEPDIAPLNDKLRLIFIGRIYQIKDLETLCDAIDTVDSDKIELTMACICGSDEYAQRIKKRMSNRENINWMENIPQRELSQLIRNNDFLVLTSISEMSPLVILESFANGVPVIATDIPPVQDNVQNGLNGILFPVGDSKKLTYIINDLINNPTKKSILKSNVKPPRTFDNVASELLEIYNS